MTTHMRMYAGWLRPLCDPFGSPELVALTSVEEQVTCEYCKLLLPVYKYILQDKISKLEKKLKRVQADDPTVQE